MERFAAGGALVSEASASPRPRGQAVGEPEVRAALRGYLRGSGPASLETLLLDEVGLCQGRTRIDLLAVSGVLHGYEIKSERDRLDRLGSQAATYGRVLDRVTLVACERHFESALRLVPGWWGALLVRGGSGSVSLEPVRPAAENPGQDPRALVELLWRAEALELLASRGAADGLGREPRSAVWDRVCEIVDVTEIRAAVRKRLRERERRHEMPEEQEPRVPQGGDGDWIDAIVEGPGGRAAPLRRAAGPEEVGRALEPGVIVETDLATAIECGAWLDGTDDPLEAFEAAEDPAVFGAPEG